MSKTFPQAALPRKFATIGAALTAVALAAGSPARADTTVFATGFEAPAYSPGQLAGQNGWFQAPNAFVQTSVVSSGAQAVTVDPGATGQHNTGVGVSYNSVGNVEHVVTISTDFMFLQGPGVVWEALSAFGNGGFITQLVVNGATGQACGFNPCNGPILTAGTWYSLAMELDYSTGFVRDFVNGVEFSSGPFSNIPSHSTTLSAIAIGTNSVFTAGSSARATWDNISVTSSAVPEPASWALMMAGFGMLGFVRRRRAATQA